MRSDRFALLSLVVPFLTLAASELARAHVLLPNNTSAGGAARIAGVHH